MKKYYIQNLRQFQVMSFVAGLIFAVLAICSVNAKVFAEAPLAAPTGLTAAGGGNSIAVVWKPVPGAAKYFVFRDGTKIATTAPSPNPVPAYKSGSRYIDASVIKNRTYSYTVQAVQASGQVSTKSNAVAAKISSGGNPVPAIATGSGSDASYAAWVADAKEEMRIWYPKLSDKLALGKYTPPTNFSVRVVSMSGIASTSGTTISVSKQWLSANRQEYGVVIHEMAHVMQNYKGNGAYWATEGLADWTRVHFYRDPAKKSTPPQGHELYTQGYEPAAGLLNYIDNQVGGSFLKSLNTALKNDSYNDVKTIASLTGKSQNKWWQNYTGDAVTTSQMKLSYNTYFCLDGGSNLSKQNGTKVQLLGCNNAEEQTFYFVKPAGKTYMYAHVGAYCMDVSSSGTANGTPVQLWGCNGTSAQQWKPRTDGGLINTNSAKCLTAPSVTSGIQMEIETCGGLPRQIWNSSLREESPTEDL